MSSSEIFLNTTLPTLIWKDKTVGNTKLIMSHYPTTAATYPTYFLTFFLLFIWVHLDLQTHIYTFFFSFSDFLSKSTLISARAQIKQLGPFDSLPTYKSAKIELFGQMHSLYSKTRNWNLGRSRLDCLHLPLRNLFKAGTTHQNWNTTVAFGLAHFLSSSWVSVWKYGTLQHERWHIWHVKCQSWKMKPCCNRRLTVAPLGDGFSLWKAKNSRSDCLDFP